MKHTLYHNTVSLTGPKHIVDDIYKCLGPWGINIHGYIPKPLEVHNADYFKFVRYWEKSHWGFVGRTRLITKVQTTIERKDECPEEILSSLTFRLMTKDGSLEKLVAKMASTHPRVYFALNFWPLREPEMSCLLEFSHGVLKLSKGPAWEALPEMESPLVTAMNGIKKAIAKGLEVSEKLLYGNSATETGAAVREEFAKFKDLVAAERAKYRERHHRGGDKSVGEK
jgi:hypothetical protein